MATLVASSKNYAWRHVLVYENYQPVNQAVNNFINALFAEKKRQLALSRLQLKYGKHFYTPSDEWNERFIRYKSYKG
jgi:hypothetical protein